MDWRRIANPYREIQGWPALSHVNISETAYNAEGQITEGDEHSVAFFRQFHLPFIEMAGIDPARSRILEIGSGFGQLAYGTFGCISPELYVATDVFPALLDILSENISKWSKGSEFGLALYDPQAPLYINSGAFNVIQSHAVLHHVLDYTKAVQSMYQVLDTPGVMIFTEPCLESYLTLQAILRLFQTKYRIPEKLKTEIGYLDEYISQRAGADRNNKKFLSQFGDGDKYLFSAYDLFELSKSVGAKLHVIKDSRDPRGNLLFELKIRGADDETLVKFNRFLKNILPTGIENAYFSDFRQVFCLIKA